MTRTKRLITGGIAIWIAIVLAACSTGSGVDLGDSKSSAGGGDLTVAIGGEPDQLDPQKTSAYFSFEVLENVFDTLVQPDEQLKMVPALATSWQTSKDQLTWTFHLRKGVKFHDGKEFTADDVVYSYNRIIDDKLSNAYKFASVKKITAVDDQTVQIRVKQPTPNLLSNIGGFKGMAIVEKKNVQDKEIGKHPIGTGPFEFDSYSQGDKITLKANKNYWGGAPKISTLTFRFINEPATAIADLTSGEIQWTDQVPNQQVKTLQKNPDVKIGKVPSNDYWYLTMNQKRKPYNNVKVRQAISYAIDRQAVTQAVSYGNATVNQLAIPKQSAWYAPYDRYSHDPAKAKQLLSQASVKKLTMGLMVSSDYPETVTAAQVIASELKPLGITVKIRTLDFASWLDEQNSGNFDMLMMGWLGNIDPDDFYYNQQHTDGSSNAQGYSNPEVDKLLDKGRITTDTAKRKQIYAEAATKIADDASYIYLYNPDVVQAWSPKLQGYQVRSDRAIRFAHVSLNG